MAITLTYTQPGVNPVADLAGNLLDTTNGVSVTNNVMTFAFTDNGDGSFEVTTEGGVPTPSLTDNTDGSVTVDVGGAYIFKPDANAEDDFTGAIGSETLTTATGAGTFKVYKLISADFEVTSGVALPQPSYANIVAMKNNWSDLTATGADDDGPETRQFTNVDTTKITVVSDGFAAGIDAADFTSGGWLEFGSPKLGVSSGTPFSLEMWINWSSVAGWPASGRALSGRGDAVSGEFSWTIDPDGASRFLTWNGTSGTVHLDSDPTLLSLDTWHHLCVERTAGDVWYMYIDGVQVSTTTVTPTISSTTVDTAIGHSDVNATRRLNGLLGPVRFVQGESVYNGTNFTPQTQFPTS